MRLKADLIPMSDTDTVIAQGFDSSISTIPKFPVGVNDIMTNVMMTEP